MERDYYDEARQLASAIRTSAEAQAVSAARIEDAIASGFTATEILMGLRFQIRELLGDDRVSLPSDVRTSASELAGAIDEALGA